MSLERRIIEFLRENPGANAREIAEALGVSYGRIQAALYRLREKGAVIKTGFGYAVSHTLRNYLEEYRETEIRRWDTKTTQLMEKTKEAFERRIEELEKTVNELLKQYSVLKENIGTISKKLEQLLSNIKNLERKVSELSNIISSVPTKRKEEKDRFLMMLKKEGIMDVGKARSLAIRSLEEYVRSNSVVAVSSFIVDREFYEKFKRKFPIPKDRVSSLSEKEKTLLRALVDEGLAYLHRGIEYRLV